MSIPVMRIKAHANCTAIGIRYEPVSEEKGNQYLAHLEGFGSHLSTQEMSLSLNTYRFDSS
jgi:hypothetical protein